MPLKTITTLTDLTMNTPKMNNPADEICVGLRFKSVWFECQYVEVTEIDEAANKLSVKIVRSAQHWHFEDHWDLAVTRLAFMRREYFKI